MRNKLFLPSRVLDSAKGVCYPPFRLPTPSDVAALQTLYLSRLQPLLLWYPGPNLYVPFSTVLVPPVSHLPDNLLLPDVPFNTFDPPPEEPELLCGNAGPAIFIACFLIPPPFPLAPVSSFPFSPLTPPTLISFCKSSPKCPGIFIPSSGNRVAISNCE